MNDSATRRDQAKEALAQLLADFASRKKPIRVVMKSAYWHQRAAGKALFLITFGGQRTYLSSYITTLGHTIYVPDDFDSWDPRRALEILRHEAVHVAQFERYGWIGMILLYGVLPLPMGLSWFRARLEWEAYEETFWATAEVEGIAAARSPELRAQIVRRFTGPDYAWMWPFPRMVERWIDEVLAEIEKTPDGKRPSTSRTQSG
ncbi:MAG TPA: hypothetical protein PK156_46255 [Polyangium sp.]|nr:hypothetical protein [Polyangium sp.]